MSVEAVGVTIAIGVGVWIGTYVPFRRMLEGVTPDHASLLAVGFSALLGATALIAWQQETLFAVIVLGLCLAFMLIYVGLVLSEKYRQG